MSSKPTQVHHMATVRVQMNSHNTSPKHFLLHNKLY